MVKAYHSIRVIIKPIAKGTVLKDHWETHSTEEKSNSIEKLSSSNSWEIKFI